MNYTIGDINFRHHFNKNHASYPHNNYSDIYSELLGTSFDTFMRMKGRMNFYTVDTALIVVMKNSQLVVSSNSSTTLIKEWIEISKRIDFLTTS